MSSYPIRLSNTPLSGILAHHSLHRIHASPSLTNRGAELTRTYDERSRLFGWRDFVIGGMTIVLALPAISELTGNDDQASKVASMGIFAG